MGWRKPRKNVVRDRNQSKAEKIERRQGKRWRTYRNLWRISCGDHRRSGLEYELDIACRKIKLKKKRKNTEGGVVRLSLEEISVSEMGIFIYRNVLLSLFPFEDGRFQRPQWRRHVRLLDQEILFSRVLFYVGSALGRVWPLRTQLIHTGDISTWANLTELSRWPRLRLVACVFLYNWWILWVELIRYKMENFQDNKKNLSWYFNKGKYSCER